MLASALRVAFAITRMGVDYGEWHRSPRSALTIFQVYARKHGVYDNFAANLHDVFNHADIDIIRRLARPIRMTLDATPLLAYHGDDARMVSEAAAGVRQMALMDVA